MYQYDDYGRDPFMEPEGPPSWLGTLILFIIVVTIAVGLHEFVK